MIYIDYISLQISLYHTSIGWTVYIDSGKFYTAKWTTRRLLFETLIECLTRAKCPWWHCWCIQNRTSYRKISFLSLIYTQNNGNIRCFRPSNTDPLAPHVVTIIERRCSDNSVHFRRFAKTVGYSWTRSEFHHSNVSWLSFVNNQSPIYCHAKSHFLW